MLTPPTIIAAWADGRGYRATGIITTAPDVRHCGRGRGDHAAISVHCRTGGPHSLTSGVLIRLSVSWGAAARHITINRCQSKRLVRGNLMTRLFSEGRVCSASCSHLYKKRNGSRLGTKTSLVAHGGVYIMLLWNSEELGMTPCSTSAVFELQRGERNMQQPPRSASVSNKLASTLGQVAYIFLLPFL